MFINKLFQKIIYFVRIRKITKSWQIAYVIFNYPIYGTNRMPENNFSDDLIINLWFLLNPELNLIEILAF